MHITAALPNTAWAKAAHEARHPLEQEDKLWEYRGSGESCIIRECDRLSRLNVDEDEF